MSTIITTAAELEALPIGSVIRSDDGSTWAREAFPTLWPQGDSGATDSAWAQTGVEDMHSSQWLAEWGYLPAAVLYTPQEADRV